MGSKLLDTLCLGSLLVVGFMGIFGTDRFWKWFTAAVWMVVCAVAAVKIWLGPGG